MPKSTLTINIRKIYHLLEFSNFDYLGNRVDMGEISSGKVREVVGLSEAMNKMGHPTYLNNDEESFIVTLADIGGVHSLPMDTHYLT